MSLDFSAITAASTVTPAATQAAGTTKKGAEVGSQDYFLKLLVAQMNNQDPLNPLDSAQMTSQLAQLNTVQGINNLATKLDALLGGANATQAVEASSLVGHTVAATGSTLALADGAALGAVDLAGSVDHLVVTIKDGSGNAVRSVDLGKQSAGLVEFAWDGTTDAGAAVAPGTYAFSAEGKAGGAKVGATTLSTGRVTGVTPGANGASLVVGTLGTFDMNQVRRIY